MPYVTAIPAVAPACLPAGIYSASLHEGVAGLFTIHRDEAHAESRTYGIKTPHHELAVPHVRDWLYHVVWRYYLICFSQRDESLSNSFGFEYIK